MRVSESDLFPPVGFNVDLLWMNKILHHLETMKNHCLLVFTGESSFQRFLGGAGCRKKE